MLRWPQKPKLRPEVEAELERRGLDAMRSFLHWQGGHEGVGMDRDKSYPLGTIKVTRGDLEDWLTWKGAVEGLWIRISAVAAIIAAALLLVELLQRIF